MCPIIVVYGWGRGKEDEGCSFSSFSFSACMIFYFAFENQNDGGEKNTMKIFLIKNKQQNICFKLEDLILKIFTRTRPKNTPRVFYIETA